MRKTVLSVLFFLAAAWVRPQQQDRNLFMQKPDVSSRPFAAGSFIVTIERTLSLMRGHAFPVNK